MKNSTFINHLAKLAEEAKELDTDAGRDAYKVLCEIMREYILSTLNR